MKPAVLGWIGWVATGVLTVASADPVPVLALQDSGLIADRSIRFTEPSGLAFDVGKSMLWSVSDNAKSVFLIAPGSGAVIRTLPVGHKQLEGVSVDFDTNKLLFVREKDNLILRYDLARKSVVRAVRLSDLEGYAAIARKFGPDEGNKGLEGITIDVTGRRVFVVKEARPRLLIQISPDLNRIEGHWNLTADLGFKVAGVSDKKLDISGLAFDAARQAIWMVSDTGGCVFLFDLATMRGQRIGVRPEPGGTIPGLRGIEGLAISDAHDAIHAVTDDGDMSKRFVFSVR